MKNEKFRYDLHTHTTMHSDCSDMEPRELVDRAIELGLDGVAITDHNAMWRRDAIEELREYAASKGDLAIFNAQEVRSFEGCDFLVFGAGETIECYRYTNMELSRHLAGRGIPVIGAHPLRDGFAFGDDLEKIDFTAVEVYNCREKREEEKLLAFAARKRIKTIGGSDSHDWSRVGRIVTEFDEAVTDETHLMELLKYGEYRAVRMNVAIR